LYYLIGSLFDDEENNEYKKLGAFGTVAMFIGFSFKWFWEELADQDLRLLSPEFIVAVFVSVLALVLFFYKQKRKPDAPFNPLELAFVWFILIFVAGIYSYVLATVLTNIVALAIGVYTVVKGSKQNHLGILNYGLLIITALVVCRFFDTNMTFVVRGILFVLVGIGFFVANYSMLQKRRSHE
jgi:MFS family permease